MPVKFYFHESLDYFNNTVENQYATTNYVAIPQVILPSNENRYQVPDIFPQILGEWVQRFPRF